MKTLNGLLTALILSFLCSCGSTNLDRTTAMKLVEPSSFPVNIFIPDLTASRVHSEDMPIRQKAFNELNAAGVLACSYQDSIYSYYVRCQPGPASKDSRAKAFSAFGIIIGHLRPKAITGVAQLTLASAEAQVSLGFEFDPIYNKYQAFLDAVAVKNPSTDELTVEESKRHTSAVARFQRYDDGWRLESIKLR